MVLVAMGADLQAAPSKPELELRVPAGGIQPQAVGDASGAIHLLYFTGDPRGGDLRYTFRRSDDSEWRPSIRVNSVEGSAMAVGTIRGGQIAMGRGGRVHVAWMGSGKAVPAQVGGKPESPMLYSRLNSDRTAFEPERNLLKISGVLDGGGSVAADDQGRVWVAWHGQRPGEAHREQARELFATFSRDDGTNFEEEQSIGPKGAGSCACCGMKALALPDGSLLAAYRTARNSMDRDMTLVWHGGKERPWGTRDLAPWRIPACPMSSASLQTSASHVWAAWEQDGRIQARGWWIRSDQATPLLEPARGDGKMRHPSLAVAEDGQILLAWTEGTGWNKGGRAVWQRFSKEGKAIGHPWHRDGVPAWGTVAAGAAPGGFWIIY